MIDSTSLKNYLLIAFLGVLFSCTSNQQQETQEMVLVHEDTLPLSPPPPKDTVTKLTNAAQIQNAYAEIIADYEKGKLDSTSFKYNCNGEKSGTVTYFSQKGDLKMITHTYAEYDHHEMKDRYFVQDSIPFFAHLRSLSWSFESGPEGATKDQITEQRIYLLNWKPIQCLEKKYEIRLHAGVNPKPADVQNKTVDCTSTKSIEKPYRLLVKYWNVPAPKCLSY